MQPCPICEKVVDRLCIVSAFIPGRDAKGTHNTVELGHMCTYCVSKMIAGEIQLPTPENALSFDEMIGAI